MAITSAFQVDDAGSIPADRSNSQLYKFQEDAMSLRSSLCGWEETDQLTYKNFHYLLNGNLSCCPEFLDFQHEIFGIKHRYLIKNNRAGDVKAALCVWNDKYLANDAFTRSLTGSKSLPISTDELVLPISTKASLVLPFKSKLISSLHRDNIINTSFRFNANRRVCIARNTYEYSSKTRQTRKREIRKFLAHEGEVINITKFTADHLMHIYDELFLKRRNRHTRDIALNIDFMQKFKDNFFGNILLYKGNPCALQLITMKETKDKIFFDYINIGYDVALKSFCLGTILTWINLESASELCNARSKIMHFSFGKPTCNYKSRWCITQNLGRCLCI